MSGIRTDLRNEPNLAPLTGWTKSKPISSDILYRHACPLFYVKEVNYAIIGVFNTSINLTLTVNTTCQTINKLQMKLFSCASDENQSHRSTLGPDLDFL